MIPNRIATSSLAVTGCDGHSTPATTLASWKLK
jgi:hypothetical protein